MAKNAGEIAVPISDLTSRLTIVVSGLRGFTLRLWLARRLFVLGARIAGVGIVLDVTKEGDEWRSYESG